jgi:glycogen(starch) synthase
VSGDRGSEMRDLGRLRILHVLDHSLPLQSGYVFRSLGILGAQHSFGWKTVQITTPRHNAGAPAVERVDGWEFHRTPKPTGPFAGWPVVREGLEMRASEMRLDGLIRQFRPDIVHAHSPMLNGIPAQRAARRAGVPMVYEVRALWEDAAVDEGTTRENDLRYRATRALETRVMRRADAVVTLCEAMREELVGRGLPREKITVVPNAVNPELFGTVRKVDPALAQSLGLTCCTVLGFIGSFYHYEGLDILLAALPEIRANLPDIRVLLVGGGNEAKRLQAQSRRLGLEDVVRFTGRVAHERVQDYYDLVNFFVYPRRSMRLTDLVTPLKPLEAMANRSIVIASDVGGHRELIRDGETGYLVRAGDPAALARGVVSAVRDTASHPAMRRAGRAFVEAERTWAASSAQYKPLYARLLGG